jgi:CHC2 zinc finger
MAVERCNRVPRVGSRPERLSLAEGGGVTHDAREVKAQCDFLALVRRYVPNLRRAGRQHVGSCFFHSESSPSLYIEPARKIWKCFGCGRGGDVFDFIMLAEGCDFRRALEIVTSLGVAAVSEGRRPERFDGGVGASPRAAQRPASYSQFTEEPRARILAGLEATDRRLRAIEATNRAAALSLATACEPDRSERSEAPLLEKPG